MFSCISSALMGHLHVQLTARGWLLAVLGATMLAACVILIKAGMNRISAQEASILCVLEPIVSLVAGALILHEIISVKAAVGSALVIGAALAICFPARTTAKISEEIAPACRRAFRPCRRRMRRRGRRGGRGFTSGGGYDIIQ